jgi:hypothetical protein
LHDGEKNIINVWPAGAHDAKRGTASISPSKEFPQREADVVARSCRAAGAAFAVHRLDDLSIKPQPGVGEEPAGKFTGNSQGA